MGWRVRREKWRREFPNVQNHGWSRFGASGRSARDGRRVGEWRVWGDYCRWRNGLAEPGIFDKQRRLWGWARVCRTNSEANQVKVEGQAIAECKESRWERQRSTQVGCRRAAVDACHLFLGCCTTQVLCRRLSIPDGGTGALFTCHESRRRRESLEMREACLYWRCSGEQYRRSSKSRGHLEDGSLRGIFRLS